jgi:hypothetical protein
MGEFSFKPYSPGIQTLWFIQFKPQEANYNKKLPVDLYIPSPFSNDWYNTSEQDYRKALQNLNTIVQVCSDFQQEASKNTEEISFLKYINKIKDLLKNNENPQDKKDEEPE